MQYIKNSPVFAYYVNQEEVYKWVEKICIRKG